MKNDYKVNFLLLHAMCGSTPSATTLATFSIDSNISQQTWDSELGEQEVKSTDKQ